MCNHDQGCWVQALARPGKRTCQVHTDTIIPKYGLFICLSCLFGLVYVYMPRIYPAALIMVVAERVQRHAAQTRL